MVTGYPLAIGGSIVAVMALLAYSLGFDPRRYLAKIAESYAKDIAKADMTITPEDFVLRAQAVGTVFWVVLIFFERLPLPYAIATLPIAIGLTLYVARFFLNFKGKRRNAGFADQFEMVLRMMSGALRVGLGFRQAIILVTEEVPDPARRELMRVIGRANIGVNIVDALDEMAKSVPNNETMMFARVVRVQMQTGGDLAKVLEKLAITIRERRRIKRKMSALTAQGRFGGAIIGALPLLVGGFVLATQQDMKQALLHTHIGWGILGLVGVLELGAIVSLAKILKLDV